MNFSCSAAVSFLSLKHIALFQAHLPYSHGNDDDQHEHLAVTDGVVLPQVTE